MDHVHFDKDGDVTLDPSKQVPNPCNICLENIKDDLRNRIYSIIPKPIKVKKKKKKK